MKIIGLDKKLIKVDHKITQAQFENANIPKEQFEAGVRAEIYKQLTSHVINNFKIDGDVDKESGDYTWKGTGYLMTEREMYNLLLEIVDLDSYDQQRLKLSCYNFLNIK